MSKVMGIYVKFMSNVTQEENFEKYLFFPNSAFNIRKSYKISSSNAFYFRSYQPKTSLGVENNNTPVLLGIIDCNVNLNREML